MPEPRQGSIRSRQVRNRLDGSKKIAQRLYRVSLARERVIAETFRSLLDLPIELPAGLQAHFEVFGLFSDDMPFFDAKVACFFEIGTV